MYENDIKFNKNKMIKFMEEGKRFINYDSKVRLLINLVIKNDHNITIYDT